MERIQKYINRIYRASTLDREMKFKDKGLAGCEISYILQVVRNPGLTQDEVSKYLFVNKSTVARHVSRLEKHGFIDRRIDPEDNRKKRLYPTEKAEAIYPEVLDYLNSWNEVLLAECKDEEREILLRLLRKLTNVASTEVRKQNQEFI